MKGFVRLLESIIASVILLSSLSFFVFSPQLGNSWDDIALQGIGKDALAVAHITGGIKTAVRDNDPILAENIFLSILPKSVGFSMQVSEIPKPVIFIGCNCTTAEINNLKARLDPLDFDYSARNISIRIENVHINEIRPGTDILFIFGYEDLNPFRNKIRNFLENGGTVFMLADLTEGVIEDGIMNETFGLSWAAYSMSGTGTFSDALNPGGVSFRIKKYYDKISDSDSSSFSGFHTSLGTDPANRIESDTKTVITDDQGPSILKINRGVEKGIGRTVWFADYDDESNDEILKSAILWGADDEFSLDPQPKTPGKKNVKIKTFVYDKEIYVFSLTLWSVFR